MFNKTAQKMKKTTTTTATREANKTWKINSKTNEKTRKVLPAHLNRAVQCTLCVCIGVCVQPFGATPPQCCTTSTATPTLACWPPVSLPLSCAATALCPPQRRDFKRRGTSTFCMPRWRQQLHCIVAVAVLAVVVVVARVVAVAAAACVRVVVYI